MKAKVALILVVSALFSLVFFQNLSVSASPNSTKMYVYPSLVVSTSGQTFTVDIKISDVVDLFSWQFKLEWNATVLDYVSVQEGDFLKSQPEGTFFWVPSAEQDDIGNDSIVATCTTLGRYPGVNGSGTLATVTFKVQSVGETPLHFVNPGDELGADTALLDRNANYLSFTAEDGYFSNTGGDSTPPTTTISLSGVGGDNGWFISNVTVTLSATDKISGVNRTEYSFDNVNWTIYTVPFIITNEGVTIVYYKSTDKAGNVETVKTQTVKIDKTAPMGSIIINSGNAYTTSASVTLTLTASDVTSGVYQVRYSNDGVWDTEPWEAFLTTKTWTLTSGDGTKTAHYQVKDNAGLISFTYQDTIILDTKKPTANAGVDQTVNEDTVVTFDGSASQDENGIQSYTWTFTDVTPQTLTGKKPTYTFATPETYTVTLTVTDTAGNTATDTVTIIILDITKPTANAGSDQTVNEDTIVTFDASASSDNVGIVNYTWTFTDADTLQTLYGMNPTYTFQTSGIYTVTLNVSDAAGNYATDTVTITVTITVLDITKPAANAGPDQTVNEDVAITLDGSASSDNVAITAYTWTFTDVTTKTLSGEKPTYTFNTPGVYTVTLNVTDAAGNWATDTVVITVLDITKPVANAGQDQTVNVGSTVTFDADASSDNVGIVGYEWDFRDGATGTGITTTHTYTSPGTYIVTLTVEDAAGNTHTHSITVTVLPAESSPLPTESFPTWTVGAAFVALGIAIAATVLWRRRK